MEAEKPFCRVETQHKYRLYVPITCPLRDIASDLRYKWPLTSAEMYHVKRRKMRKARIDYLCDHLNSGNRSSMYKEYVDQSDNFRDKEKAKRSIEYGVKYLVFGKIFLHHMQVYAGDIPTDVHFGVLGILFLTKFRRLKYPDIPLLANAILSSDWRKLAEEKTEWVSSRLKLNDRRIEQILAQGRRKHNLEKENFYEHCNKRPRSENVITVTSNNAALQDSLDNLLEVDPLGLPYFDYPLGHTLNSSDVHVRSQERDLQDTALADLSRLDQLLTVNPLGPPYFEGSRPQHTPPLPLPASPATIPTEQMDTALASFFAGLREKGDGTSNIAENTPACMV